MARRGPVWKGDIDSLDLDCTKTERAGKLRVEGHDYVMRESDVCHFLVNR